jgi:hypothetical protein
MFVFDKHQIKRILRYVFSISLILWIIASIFIVYKYVRFSSETTNSKWWTFVEWIFDSTSYLPYLRNDLQSNFYQWLLFNWCLEYSITQDWMVFSENLCEVSTKDNQKYSINIVSNTTNFMQ